jgi:hypothetical protein
MDIQITEKRIGIIDDVMKQSPDEKIIFRCLACQSFVIPKEMHILKMPIRDPQGRKTFWTIELCPVCFPDPQNYIQNDRVESSVLLPLTREQFFTTRQYERAGLVPPDFNGSQTNSLIFS